MGQENSREAVFVEDDENITNLCELIKEISVSGEKKDKTPSYLSRNVAAKTTFEEENKYRPYIIDSTTEIAKTTSIEKDYTASSYVVAKTFSGEKENTNSFSRRPYISKKSAYERKIQQVPKSYESQVSHYVKKKYINEIVTEIVRYLAKKDNDNYEVYGYWICKSMHCMHIPKCQDKLQCSHEDEFREMEFPYTPELLEEYLETPEKLCDLFKRNCMKCGKQSLVSSFRLYKKENSNKKLTTEIICHLEWENHYRVFGSWKCSHCRKKWKSAYTWVSLRKFLEQTPGMNLNRDDYMMQKCKRCKECDRCSNDKNIIYSYEPLVLSRDGSDHKMELCAKCKYYGVKCIELDTYYGVKR